jgi:hypothetical protein
LTPAACADVAKALAAKIAVAVAMRVFLVMCHSLDEICRGGRGGVSTT